ncbi:MAG: hypothetical protein ACLGG8_06135 [Gammaproteobacteria bacterium]
MIQSVAEMALWSAMAGVLVTLAVLASIDMAVHRTLASVRAWVSTVFTSLACLLMCGWLETLWPALQDTDLLPLKASLGPLCGALALAYLGHWTGMRSDDRLVRLLMGPGAGAIALGALALLVWTLSGADDRDVMMWTAAVNGLAVVMGSVVAVRSVMLGDQLSRWMVLACLCLAQLTAGHYAKGLGHEWGLWYWGLTAVAAVGYFLTVIVMVRLRHREWRRLNRLAQGAMPVADSAGLPRGVQLVHKVDDALWRSARMERPCVIAAVVVTNLYDYGDQLPSDPEAEILVTLAARIRRVVGFRNVVGLFHQRCFVLAVSAVQDPHRREVVASRLLQELRMAVLLSPDPTVAPFQPDVGIGIIDVPAGSEEVDALRVMTQAEHLALEARHTPARRLHRSWQPVRTPPAALFPAAAETMPTPLAS